MKMHKIKARKVEPPVDVANLPAYEPTIYLSDMPLAVVKGLQVEDSVKVVIHGKVKGLSSHSHGDSLDLCMKEVGIVQTDNEYTRMHEEDEDV